MQDDTPPLDATPPVNGVEIIRAALKNLPLASGVYRMLNENRDVLYVGKARQLKARVSNYANLMQLPLRIQRMVMATRILEYTVTATEAEALLLEANQIKTLKPRYNVLLKDDKSFPYIHLSSDHTYPRISKYRGPKDKKGEYFGPFSSALAVDETVTTLQKAFLLRPCSDNIFKNRTRPCLQYQIKRCSAPCVGYVTPEDYGNLISEAKRFLSGKGREIQEALAKEMEAASAAEDYESAAVLRDRIKALTHVQQAVHTPGLGDADVVALVRSGADVCVQVFTYRGGSNYGNRAHFPAHTEDKTDEEVLSAFLGQYYQRQVPPPQVLLSHVLEEADVLAEAMALLAHGKVEIITPKRGDKLNAVNQALRNACEALNHHQLATMQQSRMLASVAELFGLADVPTRIEVFDNSHVSGTNAVGAMIVAGPDGFDKKSYRIFNIRSETLTPGDDYGMLREVLTRRYQRMLNEEDADTHAPRPDLILIDGGAGQLTVATEVFEALGISDIPYASIAKGVDRNAGREWFHMPGREPFQLPVGDSVLHFLERLRDEAHRFAIGAHRNRRSRAATVSELDSIAAIGPARKKALLRHFGSAREVANAPLAELERVTGINRELAKKIYDHFHA